MITEISSPERILYKKEKLTKLDVAQYYAKVSSFMMPYIEERPLTLVRCPQGTQKVCFYQKHTPETLPDFVEAIEIKEKTKTSDYMSIRNVSGLISLVQIGAFEIHCWNSQKNKIEKPNQIVMDFDPGPGMTWKQVLKAAFDLKKILDSLGLKSFVKLSGGKGLHVHVPFKTLYSWDQIKDFSKALAVQLEKADSKFYVTKSSKALRDKKMFVDYLRNARGATAVAPYSLRAKEISSVAMPIHWEDLKDIKGPQIFSLKIALNHLKKRKSDPWEEYFHELQELPHMKVQE